MLHARELGHCRFLGDNQTTRKLHVSRLALFSSLSDYGSSLHGFSGLPAGSASILDRYLRPMILESSARNLLKFNCDKEFARIMPNGLCLLVFRGGCHE